MPTTAKASRSKSPVQILEQRLEKRTARLAVIGLGYVGLPLAVELAQAGFEGYGIDIDANERVTTSPDDRAHLVFNDGSSLTVAPSSQVVIDKYVFDPERRKGEMAISVTRGALRFVGGTISKSSEVQVKTPSATMGIRGGIMTVAVSPAGTTSVNFLFGQQLTVTSQGVTRTTNQTGTQINVNQGAPPSLPQTIPPAAMQNNTAMFQQGGTNSYVASEIGRAHV